ncbi:hypothetical protein [Oceanibaculum indicum]|uniref:Uncharacterized protein n=1 Tax=Oceanibaculum indicum TaxID=526216 RepID=A0A420WQ39_9PROT|nr:hypothetical protein [Oceanibaculum indicum]RKQ73110.1 hypothetical protein BCL74_0883 [Oceanibaculum indicum]
MSAISQGSNAIIADSFASASATSATVDVIPAASNVNGLWLTYASIDPSAVATPCYMSIGAARYLNSLAVNGIAGPMQTEQTVFVPAGVAVTFTQTGGGAAVATVAYKLKG